MSNTRTTTVTEEVLDDNKQKHKPSLRNLFGLMTAPGNPWPTPPSGSVTVFDEEDDHKKVKKPAKQLTSQQEKDAYFDSLKRFRK